jgi:hypothetical protein
MLPAPATFVVAAGGHGTIVVAAAQGADFFQGIAIAHGGINLWLLRGYNSRQWTGCMYER